VGVPASMVAAAQEPLEHTGVEPEQAWHLSPPTPHIPVDDPPTHFPLSQHPAQVEGLQV